MENLEIILSAIGAAVGLLVTTVTFFFKFLSNAKEKKKAQGIIVVSNAIIPYIEKAESILGKCGVEKKEYVAECAKEFATGNGIEFSEEWIGNKIEELISFSKRVNQRKKDRLALKQNLTATKITSNISD